MAAKGQISLEFGRMAVFSGWSVSSNKTVWHKIIQMKVTLINQINQVSNVNKANSMQMLKGGLLKVVCTDLNQNSGEITLDGLIILDIHLLAKSYVYKCFIQLLKCSPSSCIGA